MLCPVALIRTRQERLAGIFGEQTLTLREQIDSVVQEFGLNVQEHDLERAFRILQYRQRNVRTVAVTYRSEAPSVREEGLAVQHEYGMMHNYRATVTSYEGTESDVLFNRNEAKVTTNHKTLSALADPNNFTITIILK